jgi:CrcB protein
MTESTDSHPEIPLDPDAMALAEGARPVSLHTQPLPVCLVAVGGALGTAARYGVSLALPTTTGRWPLGTFVVNMVGSFVLGALIEGLARRGPDSGRRQQARLLVGTGFCGALTTFSTLAVESDLLVRSHNSALALAYAAVSLAGGLVMTTLGVAAATGHHHLRLRRAVP